MLLFLLNVSGKTAMNQTDTIQSALFRISDPIFVTQNNGSLSFDHHPAAGRPAGGPADTHGFMAFSPAVNMETLGDENFRARHGIRYPYVAGAMANGISSCRMVTAMAENGMLGFFGAGGLTLEEIEGAVTELKTRLKENPFGFNLIHSLGDPDHEMKTVQLYLKHGIRLISAAAFMRMTPALVLFRIKGIHRNARNEIVTPNRIIAKVSRIEIARQFFSPPPMKLVNQLLEKALITPEEAELSQSVPMAQDLTAEADSGGHTDNRPALALLPTMLALKNEFMAKYAYPAPLCVGLAGGIATPESAAAAFGMGAAYILTGSINQSCVEAGVSETVRDMLCKAEQADVAMAPAADMFEIGAKVQVLKRGTLFSVRAEKLYQVYKSHNCFEDIPEKLRREIQEKFLQTDFESAWESTRAFFESRGNPSEIERALADPRHKMALVFRSYMGQSSGWAIRGVPERRMDYQVWCGPAMGAFNQWAKGSFLDKPENRKTPLLALNLLFGACVVTRIHFLTTQGVRLPAETTRISPMQEDRIRELAAPSM